MSYYNYIDHSHYGRIWYEITVRNWWCLGYSEEQNLGMGPFIEIVARDYYLVSGGNSIDGAIEGMVQLLNWHEDEEAELPQHRKPIRFSLLSRWRWWRAMRRMRRAGTLCRITKDTGQ